MCVSWLWVRLILLGFVVVVVVFNLFVYLMQGGGVIV